MRILIAVPSLNWLGGGVDVAVQLATSLEAVGHEAVLLSVADESLRRSFRVDPPPSSLTFLNSQGLARGIFHLRRFLRETETFDVGHAIGESAFVQLFGASFRNSKRPRSLVASLHGHRSPVFGRLTGVKGRLMNRVTGIAYKQADGVIAVSSGLEDEFRTLKSTHGIPVRTIRNPVTVKIRHPSELRETRGDDHIRIIAIGTLSDRKDFSTLLQAIAFLRKTTECTCLILGEGPLLSELKGERRRLGLENVVKFLGYQSDVESYLDASDVFVSSSLSEGHGLVLVQAMARGIPVVATDCPYGPRETLDEGRLGELVPVKAPELMAEAISRAVANPPSVSELVDRARIYAPEAAAQAYVDFFEGLLTAGISIVDSPGDR